MDRNLEHKPTSKRPKKIDRYYDWMIPAMKQHLREGYSFNYFAARFSVMQSKWQGIVRQSPEMIELKKESFMKRRMRQWK